MAEVDPWAMVREAERLHDDLDRLVPEAHAQLSALWPASRWSAFDRVVLTGSGDSRHAAAATAFAIQQLGSVPCAAVGALPLVAYDAAALALGDASRTLVVTISSSGRTPSALAAAEAARAAGAATLALTTTPGGPVSALADRTLVLGLPDREPCPGVRSWQANVVGLLLIAIVLGEARSGAGWGAARRSELLAVGAAIDATRLAIASRVDGLAAELGEASPIVLLGAGPGYGVAMFGAAKLVEAAGLPAFAQDIEEWRHVERLVHPVTPPLVIIAPPGRSLERAAQIARHAREQGRPVWAVVAAGDDQVSPHAEVVAPLAADCHEAFSPLLTHLFITTLAPRVAVALGRSAFRPPGLP